MRVTTASPFEAGLCPSWGSICEARGGSFSDYLGFLVPILRSLGLFDQ